MSAVNPGFQELRDAFEARLTQRFGQRLSIQPFKTANPADYKVLTIKPVVLFVYTGAPYIEKHPAKRKRPRVTLVIGYKSLQAHKALSEGWRLVEEIRDALAMPALRVGDLMFEPSNEGLIFELEKVLWFSLSFDAEGTYHRVRT